VTSNVAIEYPHIDPFSKYKIRLREVSRDYLTRDEIDRLIAVDLPSEKLRKVRDLFIFSCYTGLAFIDIQQLKGKNIQLENGQYWIRTFRQKTRVRTNVPLLNIPVKLIEQYNEDITRLPEEEPVFKVMSNQKMNDYLKIIAIHCGITKVLTYHIARHTFATTVTLSNGVPIESVSAMLGHKRIATTQHYAKMIDKKLEEDMKRLAARLGH
jgi:integrase